MLDLNDRIGSSFRDPSGYIFEHQNEIYRHINPNYFEEYNHLMKSGLYQRLQDNHLLIPHESIIEDQTRIVIKPQMVNFISYPYEWCFSQLKDSALLTLNILKIALDYGMILKDASAFNVQFLGGKPIFIDTLSFSKYRPGSPWLAYRQFCQHFLAPLMLMSYRDIRLNQLLKNFIDGIPLDLASALLPVSSKFKLSAGIHIHLHAQLQKKYQDKTNLNSKIKHFNLPTLKKFIDNLISITNSLTWKVQKNSQWYDYYINNHNYAVNSLSQKEEIIEKWLKSFKPSLLWDLGANTGRFSLIAAPHCKQIISFDIDPSCVESFYLSLRAKHSNILPLTLDLTNPTPSLGWEHQERSSLMQRGPVETILALGLIHHIAIVNNVPFTHISKFFSKLCQVLIIEFIPKEDSQVKKLLSTREDVFIDYNIEQFEIAFSHYFNVLEKQQIPNSQRTLHLLKIK